MKILVTGKNGQLGQSIHQAVIDHPTADDFVFVGRSELDLNDPVNIDQYFDQHQFDVIINCAAYTAVDRAEQEPNLVDQVNHLSVKQLATIARKQAAKLIHISTDYVFDGESGIAYQETDDTHPINVYGATKLAGEKAIQVEMPTNAVIVRTSWVYSEYGGNFVDTMIKLAKQRSELSVVADQLGSPTYAGDLAKVLLKIAQEQKQLPTAIYHFCNQGGISWFDFAKEIFALCKIGCLVKPIKTAQYPTPAPRPKNTIMDTSKINQALSIETVPWQQSLAACIINIGKTIMTSKTVLITGGAGFIGSAVIRHIINNTNHQVVNVDKLTYAGNLESLTDVSDSERYQFEQVDICDAVEIKRVFNQYQPDIIMHLAAESHVDRSIDGPGEFIQTNIVGTYVLLEEARDYWSGLDSVKQANFRFHHVSTDEVYGDLEGTDDLFTEETSYAPSSPYSAAKASSDHLVRAWQRTFELPTLITNCSNNYGPYQFPEKLIPLIILNALEGKPLPIYGDGKQVRDWLYVDDHARALLNVALTGKVGETYNIGGHNEKQNIEVVKTVCAILDELVPSQLPNVGRYEELITYVTDRAGHDVRYAIDASKIADELGWVPDETFESGIKKTVQWYLDNITWCERVQDGSYMRERLGLVK